MPDPDFDQIADLIDAARTRADERRLIAEQLQLVWNARGAADCVKLSQGYFSGDTEQTIERAIRSLDR